MQSRLWVGFTVGVLVSGLIAACGGRQPDVAIPLDDARILSSELTASFVRTRDLMEHSANTSRQLRRLPDGLSATTFDVDLARQVMQACLTMPIALQPGHDPNELPRRAEAAVGPEHRPLTGRAPVGRVLPCAPQRLVALEAYLDSVEGGTRDFLIERLLAVDALRVNLRDTLPAQLDALDRARQNGEAELQRLRSMSEERMALAQAGNVDATTRRQTEVDYENILRELERVQQVLTEIREQHSSFQQLRRQLVDEAARNILEMGNP